MATASNTAKSNGYEKLLRLILVGKTGTGKSSLGNVLLERKDISEEEVKNSAEEGFVVCHGMESGTSLCCSKRGYNTLLRRNLEITDTPGLFDTSSKDVMTPLKGFTQMLCLSVPGPHAVLFVVRCDVKFTKEEEEAFYIIKKMFKDKALKHIVVVFTHGETLKFSIQTLIDRAPESLKKVLELAENKYTVMSKTENMETRKCELNSLFSKIGILSKDGKDYFLDSTLKKLHETISNEAQIKAKEEHISYEEAFQKEKMLRLILIGKIGTGKSSLGNVLLQRKDISEKEVKNSSEEGFVECHGMESGTRLCCSKRGYNTLLRRNLEIIDTPGLFDTSSNDLMTSLTGFTQMLCLSVPGPHAVLFLVRCDVKFTKEEEEAFYKIRSMFKDNILKHVVVVFTHGESLKVPIQTLIDRAPESLKKVLELAENKYTVMSKTENVETRKSELIRLFSKIDLLSNNGQHIFTDSTLKELNETISKQAQKIVNKEYISYDEAFQKAKESYILQERQMCIIL